MKALLLLLPLLLACSAAGQSLVKPSGWLEVHTCKHREEEPVARGSNIVHDIDRSFDPFTSADDPFTTLNAVFTRGWDNGMWGRWQVTTREGWGDWVQFGSPHGIGLRHTPVRIFQYTRHSSSRPLMPGGHCQCARPYRRLCHCQ